MVGAPNNAAPPVQDQQPITEEVLDGALATLKGHTGRGADGIAPRMLKCLPREGKQAMVALLHQCERQVMWPWQMLFALVPLIPKPTGGERPIGLLAMLVRLWHRCRRGIGRAWAR